MQQQSDFLLDKVFWRNSAIIIYLTYPIIYPIIWANKEKNNICKYYFLLAEQQVQSCKACDTGHNVPMDKGLEFQFRSTR